MLSVDAIDLSYGASRCLRGVSLTAEPGRITCVLGRNGVGKSSLMRAILGLERIQGGRILWEGKDISGLPPSERARAGIGYVPQDRSLDHMKSPELLHYQPNLTTIEEGVVGGGFARAGFAGDPAKVLARR